ncbi:Hypothetical predicted protein [Podarcis lilfordi]|uniref:Secreted protein n=1 Tax=Podarcis lilfordi TaxID=74358 RepID=A0AA35P3V8_9SAUR|nr:Hypothetical predicted protein [Podarcis lilfordi]
MVALFCLALLNEMDIPVSWWEHAEPGEIACLRDKGWKQWRLVHSTKRSCWSRSRCPDAVGCGVDTADSEPGGRTCLDRTSLWVCCWVECLLHEASNLNPGW